MSGLVKEKLQRKLKVDINVKKSTDDSDVSIRDGRKEFAQKMEWIAKYFKLE